MELRRRGYHTALADVAIGDGSLADLDLSPSEDPAAIRARGRSLALSSSESETLMTVADVRYGVTHGSVPVAPGLHHVTLERGGFEPIERDVDAAAGTVTPLRAIFEPTPETRVAYVDSARRQRVWSWVTIAGGALVAGASGLLVWRSNVDAQNATAALAATNASLAPGAPCDPRAGNNSQACEAKPGQAADDANDVNAANTRRTIGYVGIGIGAAVALAGVGLLVASDDAKRYERYDRRLPENPFGSLGAAMPTFSISRDGAACGIRGTF